MKLFELAYSCRLYASLTDFDSSLTKFRREVGPALDLGNERHRKTLLVWLNSWGCRHLARAHHEKASRALMEWGQHCMGRLPSEGIALAELADSDLEAAAEAYGDLKRRRAGMRAGKSSPNTVTFGATGAAKVLYALRPKGLPPWDDLIRKSLGYDGSPDSYRRFLSSVQKDVRRLQEEAAQLGIEADKIPVVLGRPNSSLVKLVDEYYWVTITRGLKPPSEEDVDRWARWARGPRR